MLTGSQSAGAAAGPEAAPYLLQEDLQNNQSQPDKQAGLQPVEQTTAGMDVALETASDLPSVSITRLRADSHSATNGTKLVRLLQVSAVHRGDTER